MVRLTVITREVSPAIAKCELTHIHRQPIHYEKVVEEHDAYVDVFQQLVKEGYDIEVVRLPALPSYPDSMFVEDVAMIYDGVAVISRPGASSRRDETGPIRRWLSFLRPGHVHELTAPARADGGDIFPVGKYIFIGDSTRTNDDAFAQMQKAVAGYAFIDAEGRHHPYECVRLPVHGRLHTKTAGSFLDDNTVLMDTAACESTVFTTRGITVLAAPAGEEGGSNPLSFVVSRPDGSGTKRVVVLNKGYPHTTRLVEEWAQRMTAAGRPTAVLHLHMDEMAKAEGSLTCLSLLCYHKESSPGPTLS